MNNPSLNINAYLTYFRRFRYDLLNKAYSDF